MLEHKSFPVEVKATGTKDGGRFEAIVAVFNNIDEIGDRILPGAFKRTLEPPPEGRGFPPIVWSHIWSEPPIGASMKAEEVMDYKTEGGKTLSGLYIDGQLLVDENPTAKQVYAAMRTKGGDGRPPLREFSFGYKTRESATVTETPDGQDEPIEIRDLKDLDLYEVGPTLVGMNPATELLGVKALEALGFERRESGLVAPADKDAEEKKVIPYSKTPTAPVDSAWSASTEMGAGGQKDWLAMCAWYDSSAADEDGDGLPDAKSAYKLPHHKASGSHAVVWRGVSAAMGVLLGARGGTDIPASDRRGVYNHLVKHYAQFDKEPPEFREYAEPELKDLFPELHGAAPEDVRELLLAFPQ